MDPLQPNRRQKQIDLAIQEGRLDYTHGYVAFLDVLGWRRFVKKSITDSGLRWDLGQVMAQVGQQRIGTPDGKLLPGFGFTQFSDSVILTANLESGWEWGPDNFFLWLDFLLKQMLQRGFFIRGGIAEGLYYHQGSIAFGPAIIAAYDAEERGERRMRVRVAPGVSTPAQYDPKKPIFRKDTENVEFWDVLTINPNIHPLVRGIDDRVIEQRELLNNVRPHIVKNLLEKDDAGVHGKYLWFANYFNAVAKECGIEQIAL